MERLIRTTEEFYQYAKLTVNPKKCMSLTYILERRRRTMTSTIFRIADEPIPSVSLLETTQYLGAAIGVIGTKRMRTKIKLLEKAEEDVALIATSGLKDNQVIEAPTRFILPRMEYTLMSGTCPKKKIKQLDTRIWGIIATCGSHDSGTRLQSALEGPSCKLYTWLASGVGCVKEIKRARIDEFVTLLPCHNFANLTPLTAHSSQNSLTYHTKLSISSTISLHKLESGSTIS